MRKFIFICALLFTLCVPHVFATVATNTGFIPGQIWYSKEPLIEGDTVNVYTALWNNDTNPLSARVEFYDNNIILGTRDVIISSLQLKDISISWKVTSGDHTIFAKITSSSITASGKKENITISNTATAENKQFVPVAIKTADGKPASTADIVQNQIDTVGSKINGIIPTSVSAPVSNSFNAIDDVRMNGYTAIASMKDIAQKELNLLNKPSVSKVSTSNTKETKPLDATQKPIAYIKLFFLSLISFILGNKIVFYGISLFVIFIIIRYIYRKIRRK